MSENENIIEMLGTIIQISKANLKLCKGFSEYLSNVSINIENKLESIQKLVDETNNEVLKLNLLRETEKHVYSDEEIFKLKQVMSWNRLHEKTDIPTSTLQYRYRRYLKESQYVDGQG